MFLMLTNVPLTVPGKRFVLLITTLSRVPRENVWFDWTCRVGTATIKGIRIGFRLTGFRNKDAEELSDATAAVVSGADDPRVLVVEAMCMNAGVLSTDDCRKLIESCAIMDSEVKQRYLADLAAA
jgi:hypothetical protein